MSHLLRGLNRAALFSGVVVSSVSAQPTLDLRPTCNSCRLAFEVVVEFQSEWATGGIPTQPLSVQRFARSQWLVTDPTAGLVLRFDERGRYVAPLGRKGAGPTEFNGPSLLFDWGADSVAVFDASNARLSIFAPSGRFVRSQPWQGEPIIRASRLPDGGFLTSGPMTTRSGFGMPFHRFDRAAVLQVSFGAPADVRVVRRSDVPSFRMPARIESPSFWAIDAASPTLRRFQVGGLHTDEWLLPMRDFERFRRRPDGASGAEFFTIEPLADGLLLVGMMVADPRSEEALGPERVIDGRTTRGVDDWGRYTNTRFYVLDPQRRTLVASVEEDAWVAGSLGDGLYWGIRPGGDGGRLVVLRATFNW